MEEAVREKQEKIWEHLAMLGFDPAVLRKCTDFCGEERYAHVNQRCYYEKSYGCYDLVLDRQEDGLYTPFQYWLSVIPYPALQYGPWEGADIGGLEKRIRAVDWEYEQKEDGHNNPEVIAILAELSRLLAGTPEGVAEQARLLTEHYIFPDWSGCRRPCLYPWKINGDCPDFHLREAFNLAEGRAVFKPVPDQGAEGRWNLLRDGKMQTFPDYPLADDLQKMGVIELKRDVGRGLLSDLMRGEQVRARLPGKKGLRPVLLEADPQNKGLVSYDLAGRPLKLGSNGSLLKKVKWIRGLRR